MNIHDSLSIGELQDHFSKCFQCLKIEFYTHPHRAHEGSPEEDLISPGKLIGDIRTTRNEGQLRIYSWYTVAKAERLFEEKFGLHVQIFRKENGLWMQTSKTDDYSLLEQNEMVCYAAASIFTKLKDQHGDYGELL